MTELIDKLYKTGDLSDDELLYLINNRTEQSADYLSLKAREVSQNRFGNKVFIRGLIEVSSYCQNDCLYCGIRKSNTNAQRYLLDKDTILSCCENGYKLGFRTFVLQGGELGGHNDDEIEDIIYTIRHKYPDCAITLSLGEKAKEVYQRFFNAGANRYLLRHETANEEHYAKLHPSDMSLKNRKQCLFDLKDIGYQVGTGFMVGSPYQTTQNIVEDLLFIKKLKPQMIGIGPFVPHKDTPFKDFNSGTAELTTYLLSILRLMFPNALIPSTTSLGTIKPTGREDGVLAGANVVMPNLSPVNVRKKYALYDNKICTGEEAAECLECLKRRMRSIGYEIVCDRGDYIEK